MGGSKAHLSLTCLHLRSIPHLLPQMNQLVSATKLLGLELTSPSVLLGPEVAQIPASRNQRLPCPQRDMCQAEWVVTSLDVDVLVQATCNSNNVCTNSIAF